MKAAKLKKLQERMRSRNAAAFSSQFPDSRPGHPERPEAHSATPISQDLHFTVQQVAKLWSMHASTIRRTFSNVPGVLKIGTTQKTLFIPARVLEEVHQELSR